ncbi:FliO/MopB family protein [Luteimonas viscosa]|nr:flagellar biosynthetic protein FliO [Luteimonas viscosa]
MISSPPRHALILLLSTAPTFLAAQATAAVPPATASTAEGGSYLWELMAILLPLAFIIVFLLVLLHMLRRRFGLAGPDAPLSVVQVLPVGPRERIVVVRSRAGRAFAIGVSAHAVTLVSTLDDDDLGPLAARETPDGGGGPLSLLQRLKVKRP